MTFEQAKAFVQQTFDPGVTLDRRDNVCCVVDKDGSMLGRAFSWEAALREAVKPLLAAREAALAAAHEKQEKDIHDFMDFLKERFARDFIDWRAQRAGNSAGDAAGAVPGEKQLVQVVP